jgi:MFS family permease
MHDEHSSSVCLLLSCIAWDQRRFSGSNASLRIDEEGWSVAAISTLVAVGNSSNVWRFLWSPLVDLMLHPHMVSPRSRFGRDSYRRLWRRSTARDYSSQAYLFLQLAATFVVLPVAGVIAHTIREADQGRASGWYQAGNLGGAGIGGGMGVWLATHSTYAVTCTMLALTMLTCALAVRWVPDLRPIAGERAALRLRALGRDFAGLVRCRRALFIAVLVASPIGVGAASQLWSAVASDWQASPATVALVTGTLAGIVSAVGCVIGGWLCDRVGRFSVFFGSGSLLVGLAAVMAAAPQTPTAYRAGVLIYALLMGASYGAFTALVLFAIGKGAASKYAILTSLGNLPVVYMTALNGWAHDHWSCIGHALLRGDYHNPCHRF